ncbi:succinate--CoA ligase subunit alpha [Candidatus Poribacteria bacterium]|nr:succinate--CoA ligase subunit alpha [Candidatus Poribacteria bacterium]MYF56058.1 succinate--CoA ligase subunit alpha [Candidatus Poribacteria bacterium]
MSILVNKNTKVIVQGITGRSGRFHTEQCVDYGTQIVAGAVPGRGGTDVNGIPVFDTVAQGIAETGADTSLIFVPARFNAADSIMEAADAGVELIVCISEHIPILDMVKAKAFLNGKQTRLIGPNCPGIITPGECKIGVMPAFAYSPGNVGIVSRSGTLTYEAAYQLKQLGIGQSTCVGIGGDPVIGTSFVDVLKLFEEDDGTHAVVLIGEIGGTAEETAAQFVQEHMTKPVVGFVAGQTAPPGKRMGHAGAIISGGKGTAADKIESLKNAGIAVADDLTTIGETVAKVLG